MILHRSSAAKRAFWQVPSLVMIAFLIAVGVNHWRSDGIPLVGDWSLQAQVSATAGNSMVIDLEEAEQLFLKDEILFLDARSADEYEAGHIQGALSLPWQEIDRYFDGLFDRLDEGVTIVTYCDGDHCDLSHELALFLKDMGFENVRVLINGWTLWREAGLPADSGA